MSAIFPGPGIGAITATSPEMAAVSRPHWLGACCGGQASLAEAAAKRAAAMPDLAEAAPAGTTAALLDLIEERFHAAHRRDLPALIMLAGEVDRLHAGRAGAPRGLTGLLMALERDLRDHMAMEERHLFPLLRAGAGRAAAPMIEALRREHDDHAVYLREICRLTQGGALPGDASGTWRALLAGTRKFLDDLLVHEHIENTLLFPRFGA